MERTKQLYSKTKEALELVGRGNASQAIDLLHDVQKQINSLKLNNPQLSDDILSLEIITFNNLACAYNKKGKYKASLYNLLKVNTLETQKFANLSQNQKTPDILYQIATTHSNLCTVYSEMRQHSKALQQIEISINLLENNQADSSKEALIVFYYNYAMQFQFLRFYQDSRQCLEKSLNILNKFNKNKEMQPLIKDGLKRIQQKIKTKQDKMGSYFQKCLKGYYPSRKNTIYEAERKFNSRRNFSMNVSKTEHITHSTLQPKTLKKSYVSRNFSITKYQTKTSLYPNVQPKKLSPLKHPQNLQSQKQQNLSLYLQYQSKVRAPSNKIKFPRRTTNFPRKKQSMPQSQKFSYKSII